MLQCVAACCSDLNDSHPCLNPFSHLSPALQCVAVRCRVLQLATVCCSMLQCVAFLKARDESTEFGCVAACCSVLQCAAVSYSVLNTRGPIVRAPSSN